MTAAPPEGQVIEGRRSLEVRWILPGRLEPAVVGWFGRFPTEVAERQDAYLLDPDLAGLSVKVRAGIALEVKVYQGSPGVLDVAGRARGGTHRDALRRSSLVVAGIRSNGPAERLRSTLQGTAVQIARALPGDVELGLSDCQSYAQWLGRHREPRVTEAPKR